MADPLTAAVDAYATASATEADRWDPARYARDAAFVATAAGDLGALLAARPGERVLDLGCGDGGLALTIAGRGAAVVGVDASPAMIAAARTRAEAWRATRAERADHVAVGGVDFTVADGQRLPDFGAFDAVVSNAALHWMPDADAVLGGVARALRTGGRFCAEFGAAGNVAAVIAAVDAALAALGLARAWQRWFFPRLADYVARLDRHGFEVVLAQAFTRPVALPDRDGASGFAAWLATFAADELARLGDRRAEFIALAERHAAPAMRDADGWRLVDYRRLRVLAVKR